MKNWITRHVALVGGFTALAVLFLVSWLGWLGRPPRMGADEEVFKTVDALFTAITARDEKRLTDCEQRLLALKDVGKLPPEAAAYLDKIIRKARGGGWQSAAEMLYDFMKIQRRDHITRHEAKTN